MNNLKTVSHYSIGENMPEFFLVPFDDTNLRELKNNAYSTDDLESILHSVWKQVSYAYNKYNFVDYDQNMVKQLKDLETYLDACLAELDGVKNENISY